jgi:pantetheine-phosphate adenylyltransferase
MTTALYAGSFDPVHLGHLSIIERAARAFDEVVVAVLGNPNKRSGLFTIEERVGLITEATSHLVGVRVVAHHGLTVDVAAAVGASVLVRSAHKDHSDELTMAATNERMTGVLTAFIPADPATAWISSTIVRRAVADGRLDDVGPLVPACVQQHLV